MFSGGYSGAHLARGTARVATAEERSSLVLGPTPAQAWSCGHSRPELDTPRRIRPARTRTRPKNWTRGPTGSLPLQGFQVLDQISLLLATQLQFEVAVVVIHDVFQGRESSVVVEAALVNLLRIEQRPGECTVVDDPLSQRVGPPEISKRRLAYLARTKPRSFC